MKFLALAIILAALLVGPVARACEPILQLLLFTQDIPGGCPVPTSTPSKSVDLCFGGPCRSFGGSDKGEFGQLKKDAPGILDAIAFVVSGPGGNRQVVVEESAGGSCVFPDPQSPDIDLCTALYKVKGIHPAGMGSNTPLCTFDNLLDVNTVTTQPGAIVVDVNGFTCEGVNKPQYWLYYRICCKPGGVFGAQGTSVDIDLSLV